MKIGRPISEKNIPARNKPGKLRNPVYDELAERVLALPEGKTLPVECESDRETIRVLQSVKGRSPDIRTSRRGFTVYFSRGND